MLTKSDIYELALAYLNINQSITDISTDNSNPVKILNNNYKKAVRIALADMDLDSTAKIAPLSRAGTEKVKNWKYVYQYPADCLKFRRLVSDAVVDDRDTHLDSLERVVNGKKRILANVENPEAEYIQYQEATFEETILNPHAAEAVALKLALLAGNIIKSGGFNQIDESLDVLYARTKEMAKGFDNEENFNPETDAKRSEFVRARLFGDSIPRGRGEESLELFPKNVDVSRTAL